MKCIINVGARPQTCRRAAMPDDEMSRRRHAICSGSVDLSD